MGEQGVNQRSLPVPGSWVNNQSGRLVNDDQRVILVNDVQGDVFRLHDRLSRGRDADMEFLAGFDPVRGIVYLSCAQPDLSAGQKRLYARAAEFCYLFAQPFVETHTVIHVGGGEADQGFFVRMIHAARFGAKLPWA